MNLKKEKHVKRARLLLQTKVGNEVRPVYYVRRDALFDALGRPCFTPLELSRNLAEAIEQRDVEGVHQLCWAALNFVHNGAVPMDWQTGQGPAMVLAI